MLLNKKYGVIYADPPWYFKNYSSRGEGRNPNQHYGCMSIDDICNLGIADISERDCVLLMWVVDQLLQEAFRVIEAWGFKYKTLLTWIKTYKDGNPEMGMGYYLMCDLFTVET